jgi:hypothetical protein
VDQVVKVSAIVAGTYTGVVVRRTDVAGTIYGPEGQQADFDGTQEVVTEFNPAVLGPRLAPPAPPQNQAPIGLEAVIVTLCVLGVLSLCGVACLSLSAVSGADAGGWIIAAFAWLFPIGLFGGAGYFGWLNRDESKKREVALAQQRGAWQWAMNKWEQLYYCGRDDVVFIPGLQPVPAAYMMDFIYRS